MDTTPIILWTTSGRQLPVPCQANTTVGNVLEVLVRDFGYGADVQLVHRGAVLDTLQTPISGLDLTTHKAVVTGEPRSDVWLPTPAEESSLCNVLADVFESDHTPLEAALLNSNSFDFETLRNTVLQDATQLTSVVSTLSREPGVRRLIEANQEEFLSLLRYGVVSIENDEDESPRCETPQIDPSSAEAERNLSTALLDLFAGPTEMEEALRACVPNLDVYLASFRGTSPSPSEVQSAANDLIALHPQIRNVTEDCGTEELLSILQEGLPVFDEMLIEGDDVDMATVEELFDTTSNNPEEEESEESD